MKTTFLTGISLTLIMLLIVLAAAFWFLYQGRLTLEERADAANQEVATLEAGQDESRSELLAAEATRQATADALATAESGSVLLEGQLVESQQLADEQSAINDTLSTDLADTRANLSELLRQQEEAQQRRPVVQFVAPDAGAILVLGEPVEVIAAAADPIGIAAFSLTLGSEPLQSYTVAEESLFTARKEWRPETAGTYMIKAVATNSLGLVSSLVTTTVQVIDRETRSLELLNQIEAGVSGIRELTPGQPTQVVLLAPGESGPRPVALGVATARPGWRPGAPTLTSFDLLPEDIDLAQARALLQAQSGLASHDPARPEQVLIQVDGLLDLDAELAHVHQFVHTLQAQHYGLDFTAMNALDFDARLAFAGLVEGEALLVESLYLDQGPLSAEPASAQSDGAGDADQSLPAYLVNEFAFAPTAGRAFVTALYEQGEESFALVDAAWQDPPSSSEQILHPDRYLAGDVPRVVDLPSLTQTLGAGWTLAAEGRLGEFFLRQYLGQQLSESQVEEAATGWGGDHFAVYQNGEGGGTVMVLRLLWDTAEDSAEFAAVYPNYPTRLYNVSGEVQSSGAECWQASQVVCLYHVDDESYVWRAPDLATADLIASALELGQ